MKYALFLILCTLHVSLFANTLELSEAHKDYLAKKGAITLCVDPDWEPLEKINEKGEHVGIAADMLALVAGRLGVHIQLIPVKTWQESLELSQNRTCDIISLVNQSSKRDQWLIYTDPIVEDPTVLISREEHIQITDLSSLKGNTIALVKDTKILEYIEGHYPKLTIIPVGTEDEVFKLVESKKADVTLRPLIIAAYTIKKENLLNLKIAGYVPELDNKLSIGVRKDEPLLRDILNIGVRSITKEEREQIVNKYVILTLKTHTKSFFWLLYGFIGLLVIIAIVLYANRRLQQKIDKEVQKNLEHSKMLFQQSKHAALGALMANISHQWRDSLTKISYINLGLRAHIEHHKEIPSDMLDKSTKEIEQTIDFMSETMQNFLEYYKPTDKIQLFHVEDSIKAVVTILDTRIKNLDVAIVFNVLCDVELKGIRNEWMQVWMNLLSNTLNAVQNRAIKHPRILITIDEFTIIFRDNGGGIEPDILEAITLERHSGLGVKMCRDIVKKYGKSLHVKNVEEGLLVEIT